MRWRNALMAAGVVIAANLFVLAHAAWNRWSGPAESVQLTERELPITLGDDENSGMSLRLAWSASVGARAGDRSGWFNRAKLAELGFDCRVPPDAPSASDHYSRLLQKKVYIALEYEGEAWRAWRHEEQKALDRLVNPDKQPPPMAFVDPAVAMKDFEVRHKTGSRLFAVDAANDALTLRRRHSGAGSIIVPGLVSVSLQPAWDPQMQKYSPPDLRGVVNELLVDRIHVPKSYSRVLQDLLRTAPAESGPRYRIKLCYGRSHEPWICGVEPTR